MTKRAVDKLGFIRVLHKATGKIIPIAPKLYNNKERMMALGYMELSKPEPPQEVEKVVIINEQPIEAITAIPPTEVISEPKKKRATRKKKTIKTEIENGN